MEVISKIHSHKLGFFQGNTGDWAGYFNRADFGFVIPVVGGA
jgi:hypothetical protein